MFYWNSTETASGVDLPSTGHASTSQRGKAPPVDLFTTEDVKITFDDWLQMLEQAASWNQWSSEESLMQLAGYLQHRSGNCCYRQKSLLTKLQPELSRKGLILVTRH